MAAAEVAIATPEEELRARSEECVKSEEEIWRRKYAVIKRKVEEVEEVNEALCNRLQKIHKIIKDSEAENRVLQDMLSRQKPTDVSSHDTLKPSNVNLATPMSSPLPKSLSKPSPATSQMNSSKTSSSAKTSKSPKPTKQATLGLIDDDFM